MQKRLEDMFKLLDLWQQYVDIIYAPEAQIEHLKNLKEQGRMTMGAELGGDFAAGMKANENAFLSKLEEEKVKERLATLFAKDDEAELDEEQANLGSKMNEAYMSVREGATTDTAMSSDGEAKADAGDLKREATSEKASEAPTEAGILSSDEEAGAADTKSPTAQRLFNEEPIFTDEKSRETVEYQFNYDDQQLDKFRERQEDKFDTKQRFDKK